MTEYIYAMCKGSTVPFIDENGLVECLEVNACMYDENEQYCFGATNPFLINALECECQEQ
jgi:hypothetical protein